MTKVTISLEEKLLRNLRRRAVARRGTLRSLSDEIQEILEESDANEQTILGLREICCGTEHLLTEDEVRPVRFSKGPSAAQIIRQMRRHRAG